MSMSMLNTHITCLRGCQCHYNLLGSPDNDNVNDNVNDKVNDNVNDNANLNYGYGLACQGQCQ